MDLMNHTAELKLYVEKSTEVDKATLIHRVDNDPTLLQIIKLLQFNVIGKNEENELYLI